MISQSETFLGEGIRSCITCTQTITRAVFVRVWMVTSYAQLEKFGWAASLICESACKAQRPEECSTVKVGCFLRRTARCVALRKLPVCSCVRNYSLNKNHSIHLIFTPWVVTSVITSFGVNIEWTGWYFTRWVVKFNSTGARIEWNSLLNEWNLFTP